MNLLTIYLFRKVHPTVPEVFGTTPVPVFIQAHYWFFIFFFFFCKQLEDNTIYRMEPVEIQEIFVYMKQMAFMAGEMVKDGFNKPKNIDSKTSEVDLVTETDKAVEDYIISSILGQYPDMVLT